MPRKKSNDPSVIAKEKGAQKATLRKDLENAVEDDEYEHGYDYWCKKLAEYHRATQAWERKCERIGKIIRDDDSSTTNPQAKYNIAKSVVDTLSPAIFSRVPRPDVSRRYRDVDPAGRVASTILERALEYEVVHYSDFKSTMKSSMMDFLQCGRAVAFVRYEPHIKAKSDMLPTDGAMLSEDIDEPDEQLEHERTAVDYIHWRDYGHCIARTWEEVTAIWRKVYLDRQSLIARFGKELGEKIPLDTKPEEETQLGRGYQNKAEYESQACIYEIWCKETKTVYWLSKSMGKIIDTKDDPLKLECFWPCPRPLYMNLTTDSLIPVPLYKYFESQADALNVLAERQRRLIDGLKVRGVYDAQHMELQRLFSEGEENALIPVSNWAALAEKQGLKGAIDIVDLTPLVNALATSFEATEQLKQQVYDLTGVADIMRGVSDPNETATAQTLKSNNAQGRLKNMQSAVVDYATDILRIKAQIICAHYSDETIFNISGAQLLSQQDQMLIPQALQMLRNEAMRGFRVEVSSDAMVLLDELQEKQDRVEFIQSVGAYIQQVQPVIASAPEIAPLATELLKFGASAFKAGKSIEGLLDELADQVRQQAEKAKNEPKQPPVEVQIAQMKQQADIQKFQAQQQLDQQRLQMENQAEQQRAQLSAQVEASKQEMQAQEDRVQSELKMREKELELQMNERLESMKQAHELQMLQQKAMFERNTAIALELIKSNNKLDVERVKASLDDAVDEIETNDKNIESALQSPFKPLVDAIREGHQQTQESMNQMMTTLVDKMDRPREVIRGSDGRVAGVRPISDYGMQ